jgi:hypothetical protein
MVHTAKISDKVAFSLVIFKFLSNNILLTISIVINSNRSAIAGFG